MAKEENGLAKEVSKGESQEHRNCSMPSTHDKLSEAHYFIHQMVDHYHEPDLFRYNLSAFLQAARNVTFVLQSEASDKPDFGVLWKTLQDEMRAEPDLRLLNDSRVTVVHKSSLIPASTMFIGHFKYGKPKSGFVSVPLDPMTQSIVALVHGRKLLQSSEHPHRAWSGEEFGLQRRWALKEAPEAELVQFALVALTKIADVVSRVHEWTGFGTLQEGKCEHINSDEYRNLRESEIFSEVVAAWDGLATEAVTTATGVNSVPLLAEPLETADVLYTIPAGSSAKGWTTNRESKLWSPEFASMLLYSIDHQVITKDTAVFFKRSLASVSKLPTPDD
jgi:hypothetical protein